MPASHVAILNSSLVHRKIRAFGKTVPVYGSTSEEFDEYIYNILNELYTDKTKMERVRDDTFNCDWSVLDYRIDAMKMLAEINRRRKRFADESEQ